MINTRNYSAEFGNSCRYLSAIQIQLNEIILTLSVDSDAFLILSLASLVYSCYSTYVYQVGLTSIINRQFRLPILTTFIYQHIFKRFEASFILDFKVSLMEITKIRIIIGRRFSSEAPKTKFEEKKNYKMFSFFDLMLRVEKAQPSL
ncbi:CLUMA_CG015930, isoform A [Clunio marinus]|uniref:CLUMA_CG015930, isoform A n=1 Tax=Clunio marinus TaxID=568069 RepID=A0A1J1IRX4_9DIPT|nr:CLUMA_CG015930, isoform A [Clunio marinus]